MTDLRKCRKKQRKYQNNTSKPQKEQQNKHMKPLLNKKVSSEGKYCKIQANFKEKQKKEKKLVEKSTIDVGKTKELKK